MSAIHNSSPNPWSIPTHIARCESDAFHKLELFPKGSLRHYPPSSISCLPYCISRSISISSKFGNVRLATVVQIDRDIVVVYIVKGTSGFSQCIGGSKIVQVVEDLTHNLWWQASKDFVRLDSHRTSRNPSKSLTPADTLPTGKAHAVEQTAERMYPLKLVVRSHIIKNLPDRSLWKRDRSWRGGHSRLR